MEPEALRRRCTDLDSVESQLPGRFQIDSKVIQEESLLRSDLETLQTQLIDARVGLPHSYQTRLYNLEGKTGSEV